VDIRGFSKEIQFISCWGSANPQEKRKLNVTLLLMPYCEKHNRDKLVSKFPNKKTGEKEYWCPDCYDEWKQTHQTQEKPATGNIVRQTGVSNEGVESILQKILERFDTLLKKGGYLDNLSSQLTTMTLKHEGGEEAEMTETAQEKWAKAKAEIKEL
jgi:hypothetical protein